MNMDIKKWINKLVADSRSAEPDLVKREKITWVTEYPCFVSSHNKSLKSRCSNDSATPYFLVFGMDFNHDVYHGFSAEELHKQNTIESRAQLLGAKYVETLNEVDLLKVEEKTKSLATESMAKKLLNQLDEEEILKLKKEYYSPPGATPNWEIAYQLL
jgi:hypothetical protein